MIRLAETLYSAQPGTWDAAFYFINAHAAQFMVKIPYAWSVPMGRLAGFMLFSPSIDGLTSEASRPGHSAPTHLRPGRRSALTRDIIAALQRASKSRHTAADKIHGCWRWPEPRAAEICWQREFHAAYARFFRYASQQQLLIFHFAKAYFLLKIRWRHHRRLAHIGRRAVNAEFPSTRAQHGAWHIARL